MLLYMSQYIFAIFFNIFVTFGPVRTSQAMQKNKYGVRNQACLKFSPDTYFVTVHSYSYIPSG